MRAMSGGDWCVKRRWVSRWSRNDGGIGSDVQRRGKS
jgi:hypothetical protein